MRRAMAERDRASDKAAAIKKFEDLQVWQKAHQLVLDIYKATADFPHEERFGLVSQMRRAAVSIPANIAEGYKKRSTRDKANFYNIGQGSLEEVRYYVILSRELGYLKGTGNRKQGAGEDISRRLLDRIDEIGRMLHGLIASLSG